MTNKNLSKSPYINFLVETNVSELRNNPDNYLKIQQSIIEDLEASDIDISVLEEDDMTEEKQKEVEKLLGIITSRVSATIRDKSYQQFIDSHDQNTVYYKSVLPAESVLTHFIDSQIFPHKDSPEKKDKLDKFIKNITDKFNTKVMMSDEVELKPQIVYGKMIMLEDGITMVTESQVAQSASTANFIHDMILTDKSVQSQIIGLLNIPESDHSGIIRNVVLETMKDTINRAQSMQPVVSEREIVKLETHMAYTEYYTVDEGIETKVTYDDLVDRLSAVKFNPDSDNAKIRKKLGI